MKQHRLQKCSPLLFSQLVDNTESSMWVQIVPKIKDFASSYSIKSHKVVTEMANGSVALGEMSVDWAAR